MAIKKTAAKKKVSKKKVVDKKKVVAKKKVARKKTATKTKAAAVDRAQELRKALQEAKVENKLLGKQLKESERRVKGLMRLLETTRTDADKFLAGRVNEAVNKFGVLVAPKKRRRRRVAKKQAAQ